MALKLAKTLETGATAEYWKISSSFTYDVIGQVVTAHLHLFTNEATRRAGKQRVHDLFSGDVPNVVTMEGTAADTAVKTGDPRPALYAVLKALPFFTGSEDV